MITQTGCLVAFSAFRSTLPPPANTRFGKVPGENMMAVCANPAALGGGSGELHAYLAKEGRTIVGASQPKPWVTPERPIETPWVSVPGMLTGGVQDERASDVSGNHCASRSGW